MAAAMVSSTWVATPPAWCAEPGSGLSVRDPLSALIGFEAMIELLESSAADFGCPEHGCGSWMTSTVQGER